MRDIPEKPFSESVVRVWATLDDGIPRLIDQMTYAEWNAGRPVTMPPPLAWGEANELAVLGLNTRPLEGW